MQCIHEIAELKAAVRAFKQAGKSIGLVPTMGALHAGHASLIKASAAENDVTIVSVFVNPTQFGPNEDFNKYPRTLDKDCVLAQTAGADIVFAPAAESMYPSKDPTWVEVTGQVTKVLCGRSRPIHFRGVTTVVSKLFNLAQPDRAYFGQKDAQQVEVLKRMVKDLFFNVELRIMPIVREESGLARSSRNAYLSPADHDAAKILNAALQQAKADFNAGERNPQALTDKVNKLIAANPAAHIEYVEIYGLPELFTLEGKIEHQALLAVAVRFGNTRLIDNIVLGA